jgi:hypothetical protein
MANKSLTTERAESLFEAERALRVAATNFAASQNSVSRKELRDAAVAYADFASFLDDLINADELPDDVAKQIGEVR